MTVRLPSPFVRVGPRECVCTICGWRGSTNALSRAAHLRSKQHREAEESKR
jgi:hypothetical protein